MKMLSYLYFISIDLTKVQQNNALSFNIRRCKSARTSREKNKIAKTFLDVCQVSDSMI